MTVGDVSDDVVRFYDHEAWRKVQDFVQGNRRVDLAWRAISHTARPPGRVLEVGCGIGAVSWRASRLWTDAEIVGVDLSPRSIELARRLFDEANLNFLVGDLSVVDVGEPFDLIMMMDVYEHVPEGLRSDLHRQLASLVRRDTQAFLSFPTPAFQAWLRDNDPGEIQPVDEDIDLAVLHRLSQEMDLPVVQYEAVSVWRRYDYAHAWLDGAARHVPDRSTWERFWQAVARRLATRRPVMRARPWDPTRRERERRVSSALPRPAS